MTNQIIHGDCFEILKSFPDNYFDAVITDPPYKYLSHKLDASYDEQSLIDESYRLLNKGFFVFFGRGESFYKLNYLASQKGFKFKEEIIWDKMRNSSPVLQIMRCHETFVVYSNANKKLNKVKIDKIERDSIIDSKRLITDIHRILSSINSLQSENDLKDFKENKLNLFKSTVKHKITKSSSFIDRDRGAFTYNAMMEGVLIPSVMRFHTDYYNYQHPTQKPLELIKRLVELTTKEGDIILDPFAGSGTLAIACLETNRKYVCIEKDDKYFEVMKKRISQWHNDRLNATGTHQLPEEIERINYDENSGQMSLF